VVTIESFDPNFKNIAKLCCIWRKLADSPEQLASEGLTFLKRASPPHLLQGSESADRVVSQRESEQLGKTL
jgi:hypothetical protein